MKNKIFPNAVKYFLGFLSSFGFRFKIRFSKEGNDGRTYCDTELDLIPTQSQKTELIQDGDYENFDSK